METSKVIDKIVTALETLTETIKVVYDTTEDKFKKIKHKFNILIVYFSLAILLVGLCNINNNNKIKQLRNEIEILKSQINADEVSLLSSHGPSTDSILDNILYEHRYNTVD